LAKPIVFISCGQYTPEEKQLGKQIAQIVSSFDLAPFFAEEVQDLNGLDANILRALHDCAAFITVLHPRGKIECPDHSVITRASVWIEQEIAIAAYIQRMEKPAFPVIAFAHESIDREGLRGFLQLNPIPFRTESDVIVALPGRLRNLSIADESLKLSMQSAAGPTHSDHPIRRLNLKLINNTNQRFTTFNGKLWIPREFLNHWGTFYVDEDRSKPNAPLRCFNFSEEGRGILNPHEGVSVFGIDYCLVCASIAHGGVTASVGGAEFEAKAWINNREFSVKKSVAQLGQEAFEDAR
jgi:hypothetical protein